jgi:nucleoside-diphosphate-sugar epimerase
MGDTILVTGAAGFVGSCVARRLTAEGHRVHIFLRNTTNTWRIDEIMRSIETHQIDIRDWHAVGTALRLIRPSVVLHLATHGAYSRQQADRDILETNILGTYNLLKAASECGTALFLNVGSSSEYGAKRDSMSELDRLDPNRIYGVAKAAQTMLATMIGRTGGPRVVSFRLFSVYGPWDDPTKVIPRLISHACAGLPLEMSSPSIARDFVFVEDIVDVLLDFDSLLELSGEVFNLGTGSQTTFQMLVKYVEELLGSRVFVSWNESLRSPWDVDNWQADMTKTNQLLRWRPRHELHDGLHLTAKWIAEHRDTYVPT